METVTIELDDELHAELLLFAQHAGLDLHSAIIMLLRRVAARPLPLNLHQHVGAAVMTSKSRGLASCPYIPHISSTKEGYHAHAS